MPRKDIEEEKANEEENMKTQIVTSEQLINLKLDRLLEIVEALVVKKPAPAGLEAPLPPK